MSRRCANAFWAVLAAMPNLPLIDTRWPLCECYRCQGKDTTDRR
ncbi:hypothetical protein [Streptomyces sp. NPDC001815]